MPDELRQALAMHQAGQLSQAALLYDHLLKHKSDHAEALHLRGVLHHQMGEHAQAADKISRAVALRPSVSLYHANLAEAYRALGQLEHAAGAARSAVRLDPDYAEAHNNLGLALQALGRHKEASEHFHKALQLQPDFIAVHSNLGISLREVPADQAGSVAATPTFRDIRLTALPVHWEPGRSLNGTAQLEGGETVEVSIPTNQCPSSGTGQPVGLTIRNALLTSGDEGWKARLTSASEVFWEERKLR